nr:uncharacterized protein LOC109169864 [Ipomoea batatas]
MKIESEIQRTVICRRSMEAVRINESRCCYLEHRKEVSEEKTAPGFPYRYLTSHSHFLSTHQENVSSIVLSNNHTPKHVNGSQFQNSYVYGVFENSINSPLSIITHSGQLIKSSIACNKNQSQSVISNEAGTTSVQRVKVRAPLNDVTNVRPSKAQCTTKVDKNEVICYNDLQKAIPFGATSSTPNVQTLSNCSTARPSKAQCTTKGNKISVVCCNELQKQTHFAATSSTPNGQSLSNLSTVIGNTNHEVTQTSRYKIGVDFSRNLEAEFETVQGGGQTRTFFLNNGIS